MDEVSSLSPNVPPAMDVNDPLNPVQTFQQQPLLPGEMAINQPIPSTQNPSGYLVNPDISQMAADNSAAYYQKQQDDMRAARGIPPVAHYVSEAQRAPAQVAPVAADFSPQQLSPQQVPQQSPQQPSLLDKMKAGYGKLTQDIETAKQAKQDVIDAAQAFGAGQAQLAQDAQRIAADTELKLADASRIAATAVEKHEMERQAALEEYRAGNTPEKLKEAFRPHGLFEDASTGQSILGAIAIGLGGIGAALQGNGAQNQALNMIIKRVDKENEMRASAYRTKQAGLLQSADEAGRSMQQSRQKLQDDITAINNRKILQYETIKAKAEELAAPFNAANVRANAEMLKAGLTQEQVRLNTEVLNIEHNMEMRKALSGVTPEIYERMSAAQKQLVPKEMRDEFDLMDKKSVPGIGYAVNQELATSINKDRPDAEQGIKIAKRLLELAKSRNRLSPKDQADIESSMNALMGPMRVKIGLGTLQEADKKLIRSTIGNPGAFFTLPSYEQRKVENLLKDFEEHWATRLKSAGLQYKPEDIAKKEAQEKMGIQKPKFK